MKRISFVWFLCIFFFLYGTSFALMNSFLDEGYQGLAGNSVTDIVFDGKYLWIGTGDGLSKTDDSGQTWISYNKNNGLNRDVVSALAYVNSILWVASSYEVFQNDRLYPFGDGFNTTGDFGENWNIVQSSQANGYGRVCYDIAGLNGDIWVACWYGGLIRSKDAGATWENVFPNLSSQQDWDLGYFERYDDKFFSVVVDTSPPKSYLEKNFITKISGRVFSDTLVLWVGTKNGLHKSFDTTGIWSDPYDSNYLNFHSNNIMSINMGNSTVWAGIYHEINGKVVGAGIQRSKDYGAEWAIHTPQSANSDSQVALDIVSLGDSLVWAACWYGGLIESKDSGSTWDSIFIDSLAKYNYENEIGDTRNRVYSVAVDTIGSDSLIVWSGTEAGIFKFVYTSSDSFDTVFNYNTASGLSGDSVFSLAVQKYNSKKIIWAGVGPKAGVGNFGISKSEDGGNTWQNVLPGIEVRDFGFSDSVAWIATNMGLKRSSNWGRDWDSIDIEDGLVDSSYFKRVLAHRLKSYDLTSVFVSGNTIWVGGKDGLARSTTPNSAWTIYNFFVSYEQAIWAGSASGIFKFIYNQSDSADTAIQYTVSNNLTGNFVVALAIQKYNDKKIIWAATNPTYTGTYGISKSENEGQSWTKCLEGTKVWNFAFQDSVVWAATDSGLQKSFDYGTSWEAFNYMKDVNDTLTENRIFNTIFYSVCAIKDTSSGEWTIWGGSVDGVVKSIDLDNNQWNVYRSYVPIGTPGSKTAYAYPSPFSPVVSSGARVRIHHKPQKDSYVTIKIYDFAMNLVATLLDKQFRLGGKDYDEPWDGKNEKGDIVVNGIYFFKVETDAGQKEWGKLVILK